MYKDLLGKGVRTLIYCADITITYNNLKSPTSQSDFFILRVFQIKTTTKNTNHEKNVLKLH